MTKLFSGTYVVRRACHCDPTDRYTVDRTESTHTISFARITCLSRPFVRTCYIDTATAPSVDLSWSLPLTETYIYGVVPAPRVAVPKATVSAPENKGGPRTGTSIAIPRYTIGRKLISPSNHATWGQLARPSRRRSDEGAHRLWFAPQRNYRLPTSLSYSSTIRAIAVSPTHARPRQRPSTHAAHTHAA